MTKQYGFWITLLFTVTICLSLVALGQQATAPDTGVTSISELDSLRLTTKIKDLQLIDARLQILQTQANELQSQYKSLGSELQTMVDKLYSDYKLSKTTHDFDINTGKFTKKVAPPAAEKK